jgi:hypothetical protein
MTTERQSQEKIYQRYAWVILFLLSALLTVNIVFVAVFEDHPSEFEKDTGATWSAFTSAYPGVAAAYTFQQHLVYAAFASLALFALLTSYFGLRKGYRWAWLTSWLLPATLILTTLLFFLQSRQPGVGFVYGTYTLVSVIALLLHGRKILSKHSWSQ